jgi:peptidoglycan/LPS O-acetylase OafA/YrhL
VVVPPSHTSLTSSGAAASPPNAAAPRGYAPIARFIANALFVNRLWFSYVTPGSDLPFWSLGYEVWYYIIFACSTFLAGRRRVFAVTASLLVVGPQITAMFPIWLIGVGCYHLSRQWRIGALVGSLLCFGCLAAWVGYEVWARRHGSLIGVVSPIFGRPELAQDYLVAVLFSGHLLGFNAISRAIRIPNRAAVLVRWTAGATFSLYLFHLPIAQFLSAVSPWPLSSTANRSLLFGGTLLSIFALAEITERKKDPWRSGLNRLLSRLDPVAEP